MKYSTNDKNDMSYQDLEKELKMAYADLAKKNGEVGYLLGVMKGILISEGLSTEVRKIIEETIRKIDNTA